jgi:hypothetical protein
MKAIYKKRLLTLAKFLRTVPKKRFYMGTWATDGFCGKANEPAHNECGTAACAAGWACTIPSFKRAGFRLGESEYWGDKSNCPVYRGMEEWDAIRAFFGLPAQLYEELKYESLTKGMPEDYLFGSHNPNSPVQAAARIERYIKLVEQGKVKA